MPKKNYGFVCKKWKPIGNSFLADFRRGCEEKLQQKICR